MAEVDQTVNDFIIRNISEVKNESRISTVIFSITNETRVGDPGIQWSVTIGYDTHMTSVNTVPLGNAEATLVSTGSIAIGMALFVIVLLTVVGNTTVCLAVLMHRKLRSVSNMFIVSLSLADLLLGTVVMVPAALNELYREWVLPDSFCSVWAGFDVMLCSASVLNICLISLDRYIAVMSPLRYLVIVTPRRALAMLAVAWGIAITASFVPLQTGLHNPGLPSLRNLTLLTERPQCLFIPSLAYVVVASTVTILLPIIIAFILYYRVSKEAKRQAYFVGVLITPSNMLLGSQMTPKHIREPFTRKATVTLGIIVGAYVVTWAPFLVTNLADSICRCLPGKLFVGVVWLGYCNSLINPIIYPFFMRDFRKVYLSALLKCCPSIKTLVKAKRDKVFFRDSEVTRTTSKSNSNIDDKL